MTTETTRPSRGEGLGAWSGFLDSSTAPEAVASPEHRARARETLLGTTGLGPEPMPRVGADTSMAGAIARERVALHPVLPNYRNEPRELDFGKGTA